MSIQLAETISERAATEHELLAAMKAFEGAVWRGQPALLTRATEAVHAAAQAHMDAIAGQIAVLRRGVGI